MIQKLPGFFSAIIIAIVADRLAVILGDWILRLQGLDAAAASSPISGIMLAIIIGLLLRNTVGLPAILQPGIQFSIKAVLRLGIVLLGIRLSFFDAVAIGAWGIPVVALTVVTGIAFTTWLNRRMGQPERLGTLIAASTAICGVTAIVSTAPAIKAEEREVAYSVATVTFFGLLAMLIYPYFSHWAMGANGVMAGLFMGTAVHETAQVAGAGLIYAQVFGQSEALDVATVTKLLRNVFLVAVVPTLALMYARTLRESGGHAERPSITQLFPTFVLGFIAMAVVRSLGDAGVQAGTSAFWLLDPEAWQALHNLISHVSTTYLLGAAMAAVGMSTALNVFSELGPRPMLVGLFSALMVGVVGFLLTLTFGPMIRL